ncbi:M48 metallopeptidase family protein [Azotobacter chroococcum]|uniref:M48 metallopeptidase family protein n=1 Tax=Azotobacter chroococcum TaxID=353 RepID=UPI003D34A580
MLAQALWVTAAPPLRIQSMQTQWGSCSPNGRITLNPHLVKAPRDCIDYVILHELCHIAEHNHSERFYRLMQQVMPQWETVKARLDGMAAALLNDTVIPSF